MCAVQIGMEWKILLLHTYPRTLGVKVGNKRKILAHKNVKGKKKKTNTHTHRLVENYKYE